MGLRAVLTYHSIDRSGSPISVTPEAFRAHIEWLASSDVAVVNLSELFALPEGENGVAITFDDGFKSVATEAAAILAAHAFPATVFVVTRHVGKDNRWHGTDDAGIPVFPVLGWSELERLRAAGFVIGSHSRSHRDLSRCPSSELDGELGGAADDIEQALEVRPCEFAYPYGSVGTAAASRVAQWYDIGCTTAYQVVEHEVDRLRTPRLDAWYFRDIGRLPRWGSPAMRRGILVRHALRRLRRLGR